MKKGKRVIVFGIFDGIHEGHRSLFAQAIRATSGQAKDVELVVIVGRDSSSLKWKGVKPVHSEQERLSLVLKEKLVNGAVLGDEEQSTYGVLKDLSPDLVCLGYDQQKLGKDLKMWLAKNKRNIPCLFLKPYYGSVFHTSLLKRK